MPLSSAGSKAPRGRGSRRMAEPSNVKSTLDRGDQLGWQNTRRRHGRTHAASLLTYCGAVGRTLQEVLCEEAHLDGRLDDLLELQAHALTPCLRCRGWRAANGHHTSM